MIEQPGCLLSHAEHKKAADWGQEGQDAHTTKSSQGLLYHILRERHEDT